MYMAKNVSTVCLQYAMYTEYKLLGTIFFEAENSFKLKRTCVWVGIIALFLHCTQSVDISVYQTVGCFLVSSSAV